MKEKMSLNRARDRDITAHQPLLDEHNQQEQEQERQQQQRHQHQHQHQKKQQQQHQRFEQNLQNSINSNSNQSEQHHQHYHNNISDRTYLVDCGNIQTTIAPSAHSLLANNNSCSNSGVGVAVASTFVGNTMASVRHSGTKYSKLENALDSPGHYNNVDSPSHRFVSETMTVQQHMIQNQDEQLDMISDSIGTLKTVSRQIGAELEEQAVMLDDFGNEFEATESKLDSTMRKMAKILHMNNDKRQWAAIFILTALLLIVIVLFIIL